MASLNSKNQPILRKIEEGYVNHPSGLWEKRITTEELKNNWEKYIFTHAHLYENAESLQHEISTKSQSVKKGSMVAMVRCTGKGTGTSCNIIAAAPQKTEKPFDGFKRFAKKS